MPDSSPQISENDAPETSAPSPSPPGTTPDVASTAVRLPARLERLAEAARDYAKASSSANTRRAYAADWKHYSAWCRRQNLPALPPDPQVIGLYIAAQASGAAAGDRKANSVGTIERRLSALAWNFAQRGQPMDRADRHVATVLAGIRRTHGRPPVQKEAVLPEDLLAMLATLDLGSLRGLRDRAILLIGFAGGLRRSEIVGLACQPEDAFDGGWIEFFDDGPLLTLRGKTGWREVEIGRGSSDATCPVVALETWLKFARIARGPLFRRVVGRRRRRRPARRQARRPAGQARGVGRRACAATSPRASGRAKFSGHSLRAGLASSAEVDERYVQKQLGHASAEMTRRYQRRRDRFRVNLTKAAGL